MLCCHRQIVVFVLDQRSTIFCSPRSHPSRQGQLHQRSFLQHKVTKPYVLPDGLEPSHPCRAHGILAGLCQCINWHHDFVCDCVAQHQSPTSMAAVVEAAMSSYDVQADSQAFVTISFPCAFAVVVSTLAWSHNFPDHCQQAKSSTPPADDSTITACPYLLCVRSGGSWGWSSSPLVFRLAKI